MTELGPASEVAWGLREVEVATAAATQALGRRLHLPDTDLAALQHLAARPQGLGPVELGDRLGIRSASATVLVDRLERAGHVRRTQHPHDKRRRVVQLTDHSRQTVLTQLSDLAAAIDAAAAKLTPTQQKATTRFLHDCAKAMLEYATAPPPTLRTSPSENREPR